MAQPITNTPVTTPQPKLTDLNAMIRYDADGQEVALSPSIVKNYLVADPNTKITDQEYRYFIEICQARKLNPFLKEVYLIKYGNYPAAIVVGKDAILKRAIRNPQFDGREQGIIVLDKSGKTIERQGTFKLKDETIVGGWAKVYRKNISHPTYITVGLEEVAQRKGDGSFNSNWANKPATMIEKVALVRALRETFVEDLGGMIDEDEVWENKDVSSTTNPANPNLVQNIGKVDEPIVVEPTKPSPVLQPQPEKPIVPPVVYKDEELPFQEKDLTGEVKEETHQDEVIDDNTFPF